MQGRALRLQQCPLGQSQNCKIFEKPQRSTYTTTKLIVPEIVKYFHIIYRIIINNACKSLQVIVTLIMNYILCKYLHKITVFQSICIPYLKPSKETAHLAIFRPVSVLPPQGPSTLRRFPQRRHQVDRSPVWSLRLDSRCTLTRTENPFSTHIQYAHTTHIIIYLKQLNIIHLNICFRTLFKIVIISYKRFNMNRNSLSHLEH